MRVHTLRPGDAGLPLLLLHAFPLDHRMWATAAAAVPAPRPVLAVDLPDRADPLPEPSLDAAADLVARALADGGVTEAVVAGVSMGGYLALALAERHPALVAGLGLVDTRSGADSDRARADRLTMAAALAAGGLDPVRAVLAGLLGDTTRTARPQLVGLVETWLGDQDPHALAWCQRAMAARPDRSAVLAGLRVPVTVLVGDEDLLVGVDTARTTAALAADAQLVVLPRAGHLSPVEDPAAVGLALAELAQRAEP